MKRFKNLKHLSQIFLEEIYFTTVIPTITYAKASWGSCSESLFEDLENIHVQAARVIKRIPPNVKDSEVLNASKWDSLSYKCKSDMQDESTHLCKSTIKKPSSFLRYPFESKTERHSSRLNHTLGIPRYRTEIGRNSISFRGPVLRNSCRIKQLKRSKNTLNMNERR